MGKTILISSHILHELAELCTSVGIIEKGKLVYSGPVREIMAKASRGPIVQIEVVDRAEEAVALLRGVRGLVQVDLVPADPAAGRSSRIDAMLDAKGTLDVSELPNRLVVAGFRLRSMQMEMVNLETAFMRLTRGIVS